MPTIAEIRQQYPQYSDMSDEALASALHSKFYADMPKDQFMAQVGVGKPAQPQSTYRGSILPFSREGNQVRFDPQAGILGPLVRAFTLPQEVYSGKIDPKSDEGLDRAREMAMVVTPSSVASRAGERMIPGMSKAIRTVEPPVPTQEQLKSAASAGYTRMRALGVDYAPGAVADLSGEIGTTLASKGFTERTAKDTISVLRDLANGPKPRPGEKVVVPLNGIEIARQELGKIAGRPDSDGAAAQMAKAALDQFIEKPPEASVLAGPAAAAAKELADARSNWGAAARSQDLTGIGGAAELRAAAANSGQNLGNSIRSRVASALIGDNFKGSTPEEVAALEGIVRGSPGQNFTRWLGNLLGGGGGLGSVASGSAGAAVGAAVGGAPGAAIGAAAAPAAGWASKALSNRLTEKALERADELTRKRSSLYQSLLEGAPQEVVSPEKRAALVRLLLMERAAREQQQ